MSYSSAYPAMLNRVREAQIQIAEYKARLMPEIERRLAANEPIRDLWEAKQRVRLQELCLADQERRLKEAIASQPR